MTRGSSLVISLDFELYWGVRDKRSLASYRENLLSVRRVVPELLSLFRRHQVCATWATVGLLMLDGREDLLAHTPCRLPGYDAQKLCPYAYARTAPHLEERTHFAPDLVEAILREPGQELATHTFSHFYCLEAPRSLDAFRADLTAALELAKSRFGTKIRSLVFPRNQYTADHIRIAGELGIEAYRGNPETWMYAPRAGNEETLLRRGARLADAWIPISRDLSFGSDRSASLPRNVPASRFLRPWSRRLSVAEPLRIRRIVSEMERAAERGRGYHLWWHPHNFGRHTEENLAVLSQILRAYEGLADRYGMRSVTMADLASEGLEREHHAA